MVKKVRSNMKKFMKILKTTVWMWVIAIVIAIALVFIDPVYTIIFCISGLVGFGTGIACINALIPDTEGWKDDWIKEMNEILDKYKNNNVDNN
jgi:hypothetical protein